MLTTPAVPGETEGRCWRRLRQLQGYRGLGLHTRVARQGYAAAGMLQLHAAASTVPLNALLVAGIKLDGVWPETHPFWFPATWRGCI